MDMRQSKNSKHSFKSVSIMLLIALLFIILIVMTFNNDDPLTVLYLISLDILVIGVFFNYYIKNESRDYISMKFIVYDKEYISGRTDMQNHTRLLVRDIKSGRIYILAYMGICQLCINDCVCLNDIIKSTNMSGVDLEVWRAKYG